MSYLLTDVPHPLQRPTFQTIYAAGLPFVRQALRWLGVAEPDLDDVVQDVMLAAYRALPRFNPDHPGSRSDARASGQQHAARAPASRTPSPEQDASNALKRWLFGIAWRQVSHYRDRAHRRREVPVGAGTCWPLHVLDPRPSSEQMMASEQRIKLVCELLTRVDRDRRAVLIMYDLLDVPVAEIARELQLKEGTVRSRLRLAREEFRLAVKRLRAEERRALSLAGILAASEPRRGLEPEALLRVARAVPEVPEELQLRLWAALQREIARAEEATQSTPGFVPALA